MHDDDVPFPDDLVQFDVMDMSGRTTFGAMKDQQLLMWIDPHPGDPIALEAVPDRERVQPEHIGEKRDGLVTTLWNVRPDQDFLSHKECDRVLLDPVGGDGEDAYAGSWISR